MDLFIYSTVSEDKHKHLEELLKAFFPEKKMEVYRTFDNLSQRLKQAVRSETIVLLVPASRQELQEILNKRNLLHGVRTIVVAPDDEMETIAIAHQLRPRFLTYLNNDLEDLAAVMLKMNAGHLSNGGSPRSHFKEG